MSTYPTLLDEIKRNWDKIAGRGYQEYLIVYQRDKRKHWHVEAFLVQHHEMEHDGTTYTVGRDLSREDYSKVMDLAENASWIACTRYGWNKDTPRQHEKYVRNSRGGNPFLFKEEVAEFEPDAWKATADEKLKEQVLQKKTVDRMLQRAQGSKCIVTIETEDE